MKIQFCGAAMGVTGSCHLITTEKHKILLDCGQFQGSKTREAMNYEPFPFDPAEIDYMILSHAHIDHCGRIPLLVKRGFKGEIYCTDATADLVEVMLKDSGYIHEKEAEWKNRKNERAGRPAVEPLYTFNDAMDSLKFIKPVLYDQLIELNDEMKFVFNDAGHILGSAITELWITEEDKTSKIVFSGDIGNKDQPLIKNPTYLQSADYVVMESTYGDRSHGPRASYEDELARVIQRTFDRGGNVVIPSFAVGRTQEMLYFIRKIKADHMIQGHDGFSVFVDSPLAVGATTIFNEHHKDCFDEEAMELVNKGINPITFPGLKLSITSEESKSINFDDRPKVIISASGMCDAGRIKHHLKHNLWRPECTVLFVGYQAIGTPGRALVEGAKEIKLFGEEIQVNAEIKVLPGVSGHADNEGLMEWAKAFEEKPKQVFVCHGEDTSCQVLTGRLEDELHYTAMAPYSGTVYDLKEAAFISCPEGVFIRKQETKPQSKGSGVYQRLVAAGQRLLTVIRHNEGGANKDLAKLTSQINNLCDKWDR